MCLLLSYNATLDCKIYTVTDHPNSWKEETRNKEMVACLKFASPIGLKVAMCPSLLAAYMKLIVQ